MNNLNTTIRVITCEYGDWSIVEVNGKIFDQGHTIDWSALLGFLGYDIQYHELTDEEMEGLC